MKCQQDETFFNESLCTLHTEQQQLTDFRKHGGRLRSNNLFHRRSVQLHFVFGTLTGALNGHRKGQTENFHAGYPVIARFRGALRVARGWKAFLPLVAVQVLLARQMLASRGAGPAAVYPRALT